MDNKRFNILMGIVILLFIITTIIFISLIKKNNDAQKFFDINDITNIKYISNDSSFNTDGKTLTLFVNDKKVYDAEPFKFNQKTGEFIIDPDNPTLYLRSVTEDKIILWYNKREIHLDREIILK